MRTAACHTYERMPSFIFGCMAMTCPRSSSGGLMSKTCRTRAMFRNSAASAKYLPGQILGGRLWVGDTGWSRAR